MYVYSSFFLPFLSVSRSATDSWGEDSRTHDMRLSGPVLPVCVPTTAEAISLKNNSGFVRNKHKVLKGENYYVASYKVES